MVLIDTGCEVEKYKSDITRSYVFGEPTQRHRDIWQAEKTAQAAAFEAPYLVKGEKTPLDVGMCFSNEPMLCVPGEFGVRLEDHFYMTESGPKWFTEPSHSIDEPFAE